MYKLHVLEVSHQWDHTTVDQAPEIVKKDIDGIQPLRVVLSFTIGQNSKQPKKKNKAAQLWIRPSQSLFSSVLLNPLPVFHGNFITILFRDHIGRMEWLLFHQALKNCHHHRLSFSLHPKVSLFSIFHTLYFSLFWFLYLIGNFVK